MSKRRLFAWLICAAMLLTMLPSLAVSAETVTLDSLKSGLEARRSFEFNTDNDFEGGTVSVSSDATAAASSTVSGGLLNLAAGEVWVLNEELNFIDDEAIHVRMKHHTKTSVELCSGGVRTRVTLSTGTIVYGSPSNPSLSGQTYSNGTFYDLWILKYSGGTKVWVSTDGTSFKYLGEATGKNSNSATRLRFFAENGGAPAVDFCRIYGAKKATLSELLSATGPEPTISIEEDADFTAMTTDSTTATKTVSNGTVTWTAGSEAAALYSKQDPKLKPGSAVYMRFTPISGTSFIGVNNNDGTDKTRCRMEFPAGGSFRVYDASSTLTFANFPLTANTTYEIVALYKEAGMEYWGKTASATSYQYIGQGSGIRGGWWEDACVRIYAGANASLSVDTIEVYPSPVTLADLLEGTDTANPTLNLDTTADFQTMTQQGVAADFTNSGVIKMTATSSAHCYYSLGDTSSSREEFADGAVFHTKFAIHSNATLNAIALNGADYRCRVEVNKNANQIRVYAAGTALTTFNYALTLGSYYELVMQRTGSSVKAWIRESSAIANALGTQGFTYLGESTMRTGGTYAFRMWSQSGGTGSMSVDFVKVYPKTTVVTATEEELLAKVDATHPLLSLDSKAELERLMGKTDEISALGTVSDDGVLTLAPHTEEYQFGLSETDFPVGGAFHFRFTPIDNTGMIMFGLNERSARLRLQISAGNRYFGAYSANGGYNSFADYPFEMNQSYEIFVLNKPEGYALWGRKNGETQYTYIGITDGKRIDANFTQDYLRLYLTAGGSMSVDYLKIYPAATQEALSCGIPFGSNAYYQAEKTLTAAPRTFEATIALPEMENSSETGGVIFGNSTGSGACVNFEIHTNGNPRLHLVDTSGTETNLLFDQVNVCNGKETHLAIVLEDTTATCYLDGVAEQVITVTIPQIVPQTPLCLGGDLRKGNINFFTGRIKKAAMYSDARTSAEVEADQAVFGADGLLAAYSMEDTNTLPRSLADSSGNGYDVKIQERWGTEGRNPSDYAYSIAVLGDTQYLNYYWTKNYEKYYDWIVENAESKKMKMVVNVGDITDQCTDAEWARAKAQYAKLDQAGIPYVLVQGNHDTKNNPDNTSFQDNFTTDAYKAQLTGWMEEDINNSYRRITIGGIPYLFLNLDFGPSDDAIVWAQGVLESFPDDNVIITTHAYLNADGTRLNEEDQYSPTGSAYPRFNQGGYNDGDDIWEKLASQYENVKLVLSGHIHSEKLIVAKERGIHGNVVTQMLVDSQDTDRDTIGGVGVITMLYFTADGRLADLENYSTVKDRYLLPEENRISLRFDLVSEVSCTIPAGLSGKIIFAGYDADGNLVRSEVETMEERAQDLIRTFDVSNKKIQIVKVFLWDDFIQMNPNPDFTSEILLDRTVTE